MCILQIFTDSEFMESHYGCSVVPSMVYGKLYRGDIIPRDDGRRYWSVILKNSEHLPPQYSLEIKNFRYCNKTD